MPNINCTFADGTACYDLPSNFTDVGGFYDYANTVTKIGSSGGLFSFMVMIAIFAISFNANPNPDPKSKLVASSFFTSLMASLMAMMGWIQPHILTIPFVILIVSIVLAYGSRGE